MANEYTRILNAGLQASYDALETKNPNLLYFCTDTGKIYKVLIEEVIPTEEEEGGIAIGRAWFQAPEVDGATVIYYDLDDENQCKQIQAGKVVNVKIQGVSSVDIYGIME
jgi:hypothetical protein